MCEISSELKIKTSERRLSGVFVVSFKQISHIAPNVFIVDLEQENSRCFFRLSDINM